MRDDHGGVTWTCAYDANGNRTSRTGIGESATYTYDRAPRQLAGAEIDSRRLPAGRDERGARASQNRLVSIDRQVSYAPEYTGSFEYDYRTRRIEVSEATDFDPVTYVPQTVSERNLSFSGGKYVQQYTFAGALEREFVRGSDYGGGVGGLLYGIDSATTTASYSHENGRGDVTTKTDANGAITWQGSYEAFGDIGTEAGDASPDRERANTKDHDWSGLINDGFRYRDPAGFVDGPNLYTYVRQNPWTMFDPEGLTGWAPMPPQVGWDPEIRGIVTSKEYQESYQKTARYGVLAFLAIPAAPILAKMGVGGVVKEVGSGAFEHLTEIPTGLKDLVKDASKLAKKGVDKLKNAFKKGDGASKPGGASAEDIASANAPGTTSAPGKNLSGSVEDAANAARSQPHPRQFTKHANERMQTRGVTEARVEEAIQKGNTKVGTDTAVSKIPANQSTSGRGATVVTNSKGDVVTVIDKGSKSK